MRENVSLKAYNTFGLDVKARYFIEIHTIEELRSVLDSELFHSLPHLILGGGSNVLFTGDFDGLVILNRLKGIKILHETDNEVLIECASGEGWHDFVVYCVNRDWYGVENLSLRPGTVGAAPMQNIGAYGVEVKEVIESVEYFDLDNGEVHRIDAEHCQFGYRESIFKHGLKGRTFISSVVFRLRKGSFQPKLAYGDIQKVLEERGVKQPSVKDMSAAVIQIRSSKLPDPKVLGNSGSFFKNPEIEVEKYERLKVLYPEMPSYPTQPGFVKVPAGWLIEKAGWKGKRLGETGSHEKQALVLVNYGHAKGQDIYDLALNIISDIEKKFGIILTPEVNVI